VDLSAIRTGIPGAAKTSGSAGPGSDPEPDWEAPVLKCVASTGEGLDELAASLDEHFEWLERTGMLAEQRRLAALQHTRRVLERSVRREASSVWEAWVAEALAAGSAMEGSPYEIARALVRRLVSGGGNRPPA
jgi:LAO/AO transport system kinase